MSIFKKNNNKFIKSVMVVMSGTIAAQAITLLCAPIITRLYGPEAYGILGVFNAVLNIITPIAALTYPIAIVLSEKKKDAILLGKISVYIATILSLIMLLSLLIFKDSIVELFQINSIAPFLYFIPIILFFSAISQVLEQWLIRIKLFKATAKVSFVQSFVLNISKVGGGLANPIAPVLVIIATFGHILKSLLLIYHSNGISKLFKWRSILINKGEFSQMRSLLKKYNDFPLFRTPQVFLNTTTNGLPVLMLTTFFGPAAAGFYSISRTVLLLPSQLIGKAVGDVFYPRITEAHNNRENLTSLITKATLMLGLIGLVPFGLVVAFGPSLFAFIFGQEWETAGEFARWLALWLFLMFVNRPSVVSIPVLRMQGKFLVFEIISIVIKTVALILGFYFMKDPVVTIALFSISGVILYVILIIWVYNASKRFDLNRHLDKK